MPGSLGEQAAQVICRAGTEVTLEVVRGIIEKLLASNRDRLQHGQQSMKSLNEHGQELVNVEIKGEDLKAFKRQLKRYGVDFAVMEDRENGSCSVFFKARDSERIYAGLERVVKDVFKDQDKAAGKRPVKEAMEQAGRRAAEQRAAEPGHSHGQHIKDQGER